MNWNKGLAMTTVCCVCSVGIMSAYAATIYKEGDSGEEVRMIQERLIELGYNEAESDGVYGKGTTEAVTLFQEFNFLLASGMVDEVTYEKLMSEDAYPAPELETEDFSIMEYVEDMVFGSAKIASTNLLDGGMVVEEEMLYEEMPFFETREYKTFVENGFLSVSAAPLSTFAADVDTASWSQIRQMILRGEEIPEDAVRIEEMLNYFHYDYKKPEGDEPFGVTMELGDCPWNDQTKLVLMGLQAKEIEKKDQKPRNFVFLIDVSGSMDEPNKLPLVKRSFLLLLDELDAKDTVSIVTYASSDDVLLDGVSAANKTDIMEAIENLMAGGSTNGAAGITTAYEIAEKNYIEGGVNRIILATDGDLNVGVTSEGELARMVMDKKENGVSMTLLGFGGSNYKDNKMEALADYGDGNYWYIDTIFEARKALVSESGGTFETVAKDVKLQVDFNPEKIKGYRLIGYEDRLLNAEDFANDSVDGGEIGSAHRVSALYEIVPADSDFDFGQVESKYAKTQSTEDTENTSGIDEWLTLSVRAKQPDGDVSELYEYILKEDENAAPTENIRFASAVAEIGMLLRDSQFKGTSSFEEALEILRGCEQVSGDVYKEELLYLTGVLARR